MASVELKAANIKSVYHSWNEISDLHAFVDALMKTLDVWDEKHGYAVLNPEMHGVPAGCILLWPHFRFRKEDLLAGLTDAPLKASMLSHFGKIRKERTAFQLNYVLLS